MSRQTVYTPPSHGEAEPCKAICMRKAKGMIKDQK